ncbi:MAG TPA: DUF420 domain-containing protein [Puia sp.]|jgi:putative membrane protein|nr:DUF420 domain-containing protein [Puia sp.]
MIRKNYGSLVWPLAVVINGLIVLSVCSPKISLLPERYLSFLPRLNAILNGLTFLSLLAARSAIKRKNIMRHRSFVFLAFGFTFLFLLSYLTYHFSAASTRFGGPALLRYVYLLILSSHIVLAAIIVPLAMYTMGLGLAGNTVKHRKAAYWTMPVWLYVSLTGVIVYLFIAPYYKS